MPRHRLARSSTKRVFLTGLLLTPTNNYKHMVQQMHQLDATAPHRRVAHHDELGQNNDPTERRGPAISATRRPKYEQVADDLRANITNGTYPVGAALPSAAALMASYQVSVTVARAAIKQLQTEGLAEG